MAPTSEPQNSITDTLPPQTCLDLHTPPQAADSSARCELCRVKCQAFQRVVLLLSLRLMQYGGENDGVSNVREGLGTGILEALPSAFFPDP